MNIKQLFVVGLISLTGFLSATADEKPKHVNWMSNTEVKKLLMLPVDAKFDNLRLKSLDRFEAFIKTTAGIGNFAITSLIESNPSRMLFEVCSTDLTTFSVSIDLPESCQAACEEIFSSTIRTASSNEVVATMVPKFDAKFYSLLDTADSYKYYLCMENGFLVYIGVSRDQPLKSPVSKETLNAQVNLLMDNLIPLIDGGNILTDEQRRYCQELKTEYAKVIENYRNHPENITVPESAPKVDLILLDIPNGEKNQNSSNLGNETKQNVIYKNEYLIARTDGKALPIVKIVDPKNVTSENIVPVFKTLDVDGIRDVQFQVTFQGEPHAFEIALRSDGQYHVKLWGSGKQKLRVLYLNNRGEVVEFGEVEVEVLEEPLKGAAGNPGSAE